MTKILDFTAAKDAKESEIMAKLPPEVDSFLYITCKYKRCLLHEPAGSWLAFTHIEHTLGCRKLRAHIPA